MSDERTNAAATPHPAASVAEHLTPPPALRTDYSVVAAHDERPPDPDSTRHAVRAAGQAPAGVLVVPGYEILGEIARGGMGRVLAARDLVFGRRVAIKVLLPQYETEAGARRFVRESVITGRLTHPGIPPAHRLGELPTGAPFLAMKLVDGRTLAALLADRASVGADLPRFVGVFEQICQAVGFAHARGVVHRDLKPSNVMVGAFGEVQVMDWGLAFETGDAPPDLAGVRATVEFPLPTGLTAGGAVEGTPEYMAPEQARGESVDARADVFALGGVLAAMLTGRPPFRADSRDAVRMAATGDTTAVLAALDGCKADAELVDIARRCLAPERDDRPAAGTVVAGLVAAYRTGVEERLRGAERDRAAAEAKAAEQRRKRRAQLVAAAAVLLLVAGGGAAAVWRVQDIADRNTEAIRLENQESERKRVGREQKQRAADGVANLLDRVKDGFADRNTELAGQFLAQAGRRANDDAVTDHAERTRAYQLDLEMAKELDEIEERRWTVVTSTFPTAGETVAAWAATFARYGIVPGQTPPAEAASRVRSSAIRSILLDTLDGWLARGSTETALNLLEILRQIDPDPFSAEVRRSLVAKDRDELNRLAERSDWSARHIGVALACAESPELTEVVRRSLLLRIVGISPNDFRLLMDIASSYPQSPGPGVHDRLRWIQAAVALRPRNVAALNCLGVALADKGDLTGAIVTYREALRINPNNAPVRNNLGNALANTGDVVGGIAELQESIRLDPKFFYPHYNLGNNLYEMGDFKGAELAFRTAARLNPRAARIQTRLGDALRDNGDAKGAEAAYQEALRLEPGAAAPHVGIGIILYSQNNTAGAAEAFRQAIRIDPQSASAHYHLGLALKATRDLAGAESNYRNAARLDLKYASPHNGLGELLHARKDYDGAIAEFEEAVRLDPKDAHSHSNLGFAVFQKGDLARATKAFDEAIRRKPNMAAPRIGIGHVRSAQGDPVGAERAYRDAIRVEPTNAAPHLNLGNILVGRGDLDGAAVAFKRAAELSPTDPRPRNNLGTVLNAQGNYPAAAVEYREAIRLNPMDPGIHFNLGIALHGRGDFSAAATAYRDAIRLDPKFAAAYHNLGGLFETQFDIGAALDNYLAAVRLNPRNAVTHFALARLNLKQGNYDQAAGSYRTALTLQPNFVFARDGLDFCLRVQRGEVPTAPMPRAVGR
mgnify:CR=1 FL=1